LGVAVERAEHRERTDPADDLGAEASQSKLRSTHLRYDAVVVKGIPSF
jgi:hypothetical protein